MSRESRSDLGQHVREMERPGKKVIYKEESGFGASVDVRGRNEEGTSTKWVPTCAFIALFLKITLLYITEIWLFWGGHCHFRKF